MIGTIVVDRGKSSQDEGDPPMILISQGSSGEEGVDLVSLMNC